MTLCKEKQKSLIQNIETIKTYFEINDEMKAFFIYYNYFKSKMYQCDKSEIFIHDNNLYFYFVNKECESDNIKKLCDLHDKEFMKQVILNCCKDEPETNAIWWNEYKFYQNDNRYMKLSETIDSLTQSLEKLQTEFKQQSKGYNESNVKIE